jgi:Bacterial Ig-like domain (group 1)/PKD domain
MMMLSRMSFGCVVLLALVVGACDTMPLTAPTGSTVTITTASSFVPSGGTTEVTAFVSEESGTAVQNGTTVRFTTNLGRLDPIETQTKNGYAVATFIAGDTSGVANVIATSGSTGGGTISSGNGDAATTTASGSNVVQITVGGAAASVVFVSASPSSAPAGGGTVTIIASVLDASGNRLRNIPVGFSADRGTLSATSATTDSNGEARVQLTTTQQTVVTARAGAAAAAATVTVGIDASVTIAVGSPVTNPIQLTITPAQGALATSVVVDFGDGESTDLGPIRSATVVGHRYALAGTYPIRVTQTNQNGSINTATLVAVVPVPAPAP